MRNAYKILVEKTERKRAFWGGGGVRRKWEETYILKKALLRKRMSTKFIWCGICSNVNEIMNSGLRSRRKPFFD